MSKSIENELAEAIIYFDCKSLISFITDVYQLCELYEVDEEDDWVKDKVGEDDEQNVRLIRTIYIMSRIAERQSGMLLSFKMKFPKLYQRLEKLNDNDFKTLQIQE